ncbi:MAG: GNAT family N-acetyltransferase [Pedobacter sp.]|nr:MAG: GNAT family N-acetyltransferase [Pedobacter sp.]
MNTEISFANSTHLDEIYRIWGLNRATLGLMPKDAFKDCIKKKWIIIASINNCVVGYLQFRHTARTQTLSIVHLCVDSSSRGSGISDKLLDKLVDEYKNTARGIKLNCRSDYDKAISFWQRYNFQPKGQLPSRGNNPNVHLVTWWFSFGTQDLFSIIQNDKIKAVLDFNIIAKLMDLAMQDDNREQVIQLQNDWLVSEVEYYKTSETISEIFRDKDKQRYERSKSFSKDFPELNIDKPTVKLIEENLKELIKGNSVNDRSDRRQLAETILSGFPYFVTLDDGILKHYQSIFNEYQLKIVQPATLISEIDLTINGSDYYPARLSGSNFTIAKIKPDEMLGLDKLFLKTGQGEKKTVFVNKINEMVARPDAEVQIIKEAFEIVALISFCELKEMLCVPIIRTKQYSLRQTIFVQNLNDLLKIALKRGKSFLFIEDSYLTELEGEILENSGFFKHSNGFIKGLKIGLLKIKDLKPQLSRILAAIPQLEGLVDTIVENPINTDLNIITLEKLLWPLKIADIDIPCFIVPIKPYYAKELFDTKAAKAELFGVQPKLIWSKENVYFRNINPNVEKVPARILWYASANGISPREKSIVCSSYLDEVIVGPANEIYKKYEKFGIYSWKNDILPLVKGNANNNIKILKFSDSEAFYNSVSLKKIKDILKKNGDSDNNFQSPLRIKQATFNELYSLGKGLK